MTPDKAIKNLMVREPFYGLFIAQINRKFSEQIPTAGVVFIRNTLSYELWINEKFWNSLPDDQQIGVLMHEAGHIMYSHLTMYNDLEIHELANIAMDAEINDDIPRECLPEKAVFYDKIKAQYADFESGNGTRYTYDFLLRHGDGDGSGGAGGTADGSGRSSGDPGTDDGPGCSNGGIGQVIDDHSQFGNGTEGLTEAERKMAESQCDGMLKTAFEGCKGCGKIPYKLKQRIDGLNTIRPALYSWKKHFRKLVGQSDIMIRKGTRKRQSTRFPDASGVKYIHKGKLLVQIDTSGSMSEKEIIEAFSELKHIYEAGVAIDVTTFDTDVYPPKPFKGKYTKDLLETNGRGGTSFDTAIQYFNSHRDYDWLVMITDGYDSCSIMPRHKRCIWLITDASHVDFPGYIVYAKINN